MSSQINDLYLKTLQALKGSGAKVEIVTIGSGTSTPKTVGNINGADRNGLVGSNTDGFVHTSSSSSSGEASELKEGSAALSSRTVSVVKGAKQGVDALVSSPDQAAPVASAQGQVVDAQGNVASSQEGVATATSGQKEAQGVEKSAQADKTEKAETVNAQKTDLQNKETALTKAEAAETKAKANVTAAEATVQTAKTSVASAKAAVSAASAAVPFSAPALAAAQAALAAAEAALKAAEAKLALAKAELEKATAQKELATAERDQSKAKLQKDEKALEKAEKELTKAKEKVAEADKKLEQAQQNFEKAQADLSTKKEAYEAVKGDIQSQSSEMSKDLDNLLKELEENKEGASTGASAGNQTANADKESKLSKIGKGLNAFSQVGSSLGGLAQSIAGGNADSSTQKRALTGQEIANVNYLNQSSASLINRLNSNPNMFGFSSSEAADSSPAGVKTASAADTTTKPVVNTQTNSAAQANSSVNIFKKNLV